MLWTEEVLMVDNGESGEYLRIVCVISWRVPLTEDGLPEQMGNDVGTQDGKHKLRSPFIGNSY